MTLHDFPEYYPSGYSCPTTVVLERVTHFYPIDFNGNGGTVLVLDTGAEVRTSMRHWEVKKLFT